MVFNQPESVKGVMKADKKNSTFYAQSIEQPIITGLELFCAEYNQSFPDVKKLQERKNEISKKFRNIKIKQTTKYKTKQEFA